MMSNICKLHLIPDCQLCHLCNGNPNNAAPQLLPLSSPPVFSTLPNNGHIIKNNTISVQTKKQKCKANGVAGNSGNVNTALQSPTAANAVLRTGNSATIGRLGNPFQVSNGTPIPSHLFPQQTTTCLTTVFPQTGNSITAGAFGYQVSRFNGTPIPFQQIISGQALTFSNVHLGTSNATAITPINVTQTQRSKKRKLDVTANANAAPVHQLDKLELGDVLLKKKRDGLIDDQNAREIFINIGVSANFFTSGKVLAWTLSPEDEDFFDIYDYVERGQVHGYGIKVLTILRIVSNASEYRDFNEDPEHQGKPRQMLWHGTKADTVASILENGLQLPPNRKQMFGTGIYFSDRISKSANYCDGGAKSSNHIISRTGYLFLCDVLLGNIHNSYMANSTLTAPPVGCDSVKGSGKRIPDPDWDKVKDGCTWPLGPTIQEKQLANCTVTGNVFIPYLQFNEYVVYKPTLVQPKYLVKVEFKKTLVHEKIY